MDSRFDVILFDSSFPPRTVLGESGIDLAQKARVRSR